MDEWVVDLEARSLKAQNAAGLEKIGRMSDPGLWNSWVAQHLNLDDWVVVDQSVESYMLPAGTERYLPGALVTDWKHIASEICEIHNEMVGLPISQVQVILSGDDRCQVLDERLRDWATRYVMDRLDRGRHRRDDSVNRFNRLYLELLPKLEEIAFRQGSANRCFMAEFTDYLPWILFEQTWRPLLEIEFNHEELYPRYRVLSPIPEVWKYLVEKVQLYQWANIGDIAIILDRVGLPFQEENPSLKREQLLRRLASLTSDIEEMRPFLMHNFKPENVAVKVAEGIFASWHWAVGRGVGLLLIAPSERALLETHHRGGGGMTLTLLYDGLLANFATPWINSLSIIDKHKHALQANVHILDAIHSALFSLYEKVDVETIMARYRSRSSGVTEVEPTDEEFAASCQSIADPVKTEPSCISPSSRCLRSIRVQRLLAVLSDRLGCEVRQGKGSEIVVFRAGGHHFRLGHHKQNAYVPAMLIKNLLRRVGVGFDEWLAAVT